MRSYVKGGRWFQSSMIAQAKSDRSFNIPRQSRLGAPGAIHQVVGKGIDGIKIFSNKKDREDFLQRIADLSGMLQTFNEKILLLLIG